MISEDYGRKTFPDGFHNYYPTTGLIVMNGDVLVTMGTDNDRYNINKICKITAHDISKNNWKSPRIMFVWESKTKLKSYSNLYSAKGLILSQNMIMFSD